MLKTVLIVLLILGAGVAWLLTRPAAPVDYAHGYHEALADHPGSERGIDAGLRGFQAAYGDLTDAGTAERMRALYADPLYFNDTLKTIRSRDQLVGYMRATSDALDRSEVQIDGILRDGRDVFVRWTMHFETEAMGRSVESTSIGMSHLRFDDAGRIVLHQDFWDSAAGIYRHLPVIGYALDKVDGAMASAGQ